MGILGLRECETRSGPVFEKLTDKCSLGVFPAPAFVADKKSFHKSSTERFRENIVVILLCILYSIENYMTRENR